MMYEMFMITLEDFGPLVFEKVFIVMSFCGIIGDYGISNSVSAWSGVGFLKCSSLNFH